jgi:hypothetical protein
MVYESNPIAQWFLGQCGWVGLAGFKAAAVLVVGVLSAVISLRRPRTGGTILSFGCAVLMIVVGYSTSLAGIVNFQPASLKIDQLRALEETRLVLEKEMLGTKEYEELRKQLRDDLLSRQRTLDEAAAMLATSELGKNRRWLKILQGHYPGFTAEECMASNLVEYTLEYGKYCPSRNRMTRQVKEEFLTIYGQRFPPLGKRNPVWDE